MQINDENFASIPNNCIHQHFISNNSNTFTKHFLIDSFQTIYFVLPDTEALFENV